MIRSAAPLAAILLLASSASALDVSINNPVAATLWESGKLQQISWIVSESGPFPERVDLVLMKGNGDYDDAVAITNFGSAPTRDGALAVTAPKDMPTGNDYFIKIGVPGTYKYSAGFTMTGNGAAAIKNNTSQKTDGPNGGVVSSLPNNAMTVSSSHGAMAVLSAVVAVAIGMM